MTTDPAALARERGIALAKEGMPERAIPFLERALASDPNDAQVGTYLATALAELERLNEALTAVERALASEPELVWAHRVPSWILTKADRDEEALAAAREAVRIAPSSAAAHIRVAWCLHTLTRDVEALDAAERAVRIDPASANAWDIRGWAASRLGDKERARASFLRAGAIEPRKGLLGLAHLDTGDEAIDLMRRVLAIDAGDEVTQANLVLKLCRLGRWEEAFSFARVLVEARPEGLLELEVFVRSAVNSGRVPDALAVEERVRSRAKEIAGKREEYRMYEALGHLELAKGEHAAAEAAYGRALELKSWCCLAVGVGRAACAQGDRAKAEAMLERARAQNACDGKCSLISKLGDALG